MSPLSVPFGRGTFMPQLPPKFDKFDQVYSYLQTLHTALEDRFRKQFDNVDYIISTGTSGTFVVGGNTITVESGIITSLV